MTTRLEAFNIACDALGEPHMLSDMDETPLGRRLRGRWDLEVRGVLEGYEWNFASLHVALSRLSEEPVGWEWAYNKPADCLRICGVSETGVEGDDCLQYADEAGRILCNLTVCYLRYVSSTFIDQTGAWPALLLEAMGLRLAAALDRKTTQNRGNKIDTIDLADRKLKEAQRWDAVQRPWKPKPVGRFVRSRRQGVWGAY